MSESSPNNTPMNLKEKEVNLDHDQVDVANNQSIDSTL